MQPFVYRSFRETSQVFAPLLHKPLKVATHIKQYKGRMLLHLPSSCPVKAILQRVTALLYHVPVPLGNTS
jgi:hypothetical protein